MVTRQVTLLLPELAANSEEIDLKGVVGDNEPILKHEELVLPMKYPKVKVQ